MSDGRDDREGSPRESEPEGSDGPSKKAQEPQRRDPPGRVWVEDSGGRRPFMRGIMVHALTARGVPFDEAYRTADEVRAGLRGRGTVARGELAKLVEERLGTLALPAPRPVPAPIVVGSGRRFQPFSKGTLAQSLLAAALEPNEAHDVAREIETDLVRTGTRRITREKLRELAYETLLSRFGESVARRFLVWREHQEPDKPVIVLVGGTTGVGKTSIALEVARRLGIRRVLSTDSIRQVMRITLTRELAPALHASSFEAHRDLPQTSSETPVIDGFDAQVRVVSVGVRAMIDRAIEENTSLVLDGVSIVPGLIDLEAYRDSAHVIFLMVARLDVEAFREHFEARGRSQHRRGMQRYLDNLEAISEVQDHLLDLADRYDVPIIDNLSVDSSVPLVIRHVVETLAKQSPVPGPEAESAP